MANDRDHDAQLSSISDVVSKVSKAASVWFKNVLYDGPDRPPDQSVLQS